VLTVELDPAHERVVKSTLAGVFTIADFVALLNFPALAQCRPQLATPDPNCPSYASLQS